jgi:ABC-2 type transport system ATP-binding protein
VKQVRVGVADPGAAQRALQATRWKVGREGDRLVVEGAEHAEDITRVLAGHDIYVRELTPVRADLESVFLQLTHDTSLHGTSGAVADDTTDDTTDETTEGGAA